MASATRSDLTFIAPDPLGRRARELGPRVARWLRESEDDLMARILEYARAHGYTECTSTLVEPWRMSIRGLSAPMIELLERAEVPAPLAAERGPGLHRITAFAIEEARKHRERGVDIGLFVGLLKYYRQCYLDLVQARDDGSRAASWAAQFILRFFDQLEVELAREWLRPSQPEQIEQLQRTNRLVTNEKNKFVTIFQSLVDPALVVDDHGALRHVNSAAAQTFPDLEGLDRYYSIAPPRAPLPAIDALVEELRSTRDVNEHLVRDLWLETFEGPRLFMLSIRKMVDVSGKFDGYVVTAKDISDRENAERERQSLEIELRHAQKLQAVDQLAAGLAHEINTPLQYLASNLEFLEDGLQQLMELLSAHRFGIEALAAGASEALREEWSRLLAAEDDLVDLDFLVDEMPAALNQSRQGIQRVQATLSTLRSFTEGQDGRRVEIDANRTVRAVTDLLRSTFDGSVEFAFDLEAGLPSVLADGPRLRQALYDLVLNAGQAIEDQRGATPAEPGRIVLRTRSTRERVIIEVEDDGPGIPLEARPHVYEPFFSTRGGLGGGGHGLAFVHRVVTVQHGGEVGFECPEGGGTRFRLGLPRLAT